MRKLGYILLIVIFSVSIVALLACTLETGDDDDDDDEEHDDDDDDDDTVDDDDDDDDDDDLIDDDDDDECSDNHAPELLGYQIQCDTDGDGYMDLTMEEPYSWEIDYCKYYFVGFEYNDDDCNLPGGESWSKLVFNGDTEGWQKSDKPLPQALGCSTEESGLLYGHMFSPDEGFYDFYFYMVDDCGAESNQLMPQWVIWD